VFNLIKNSLSTASDSIGVGLETYLLSFSLGINMYGLGRVFQWIYWKVTWKDIFKFQAHRYSAEKKWLRRQCYSVCVSYNICM